MRADRLVFLVLLLQARGRMPARALAAELEVSVRTVYRDLASLSAAGVPVVAAAGRGGGCRLLEGYRFPLRGLSPAEAEALLVLGVPAVLAELGLADALSTAHRKITVTAGLRASGTGEHRSGAGGGGLVHLDMPRWFHGREDVPHLRTLAEALRQHRRVRVGYRRADGAETTQVVDPFGLVNKAGTWYLVASGSGAGEAAVLRAARVTSARVTCEPSGRPADFDLAAFWDRWSASFVTGRPTVRVRVRASPDALASFGEVFGDAVQPALDAATPPDAHGCREVTLSFEHEAAAVHRLAGFGGQVEVLAPEAVRTRLAETARQILERYRAGPE
ncbi:YafY family protein [Trebonia sp.]|uniref:helix-turn-helix transcriptional regulator n=1 Tax=Trebonia sp. TaxID=2767075 RepID=UPI002604207C|nr:WYL domain-containing protein [Trebonia sp.]